MIDSQADLERIWKRALKEIKEEVPVAGFQAWIKPARLISINENKAFIQVRNEFSRNLLIQNYYKSICKGLECSLNKPIDLIIEVNSNLQGKDYIPSLSSIEEEIPNNIQNDLSLPAKPDYIFPSANNKFNSSLNPKFTFDNFIVGTHNQFCHAVALSIAEKHNNNSYNPFFIYGDVGLGKTHIMQAIGNYQLRQNPQAKVLYITAEQFLNDLISNMRKSKMNEFRSKYRTLELLLIDDVHFIEGKEATQEEFFHTFNEIKNNGGQIILTSDRRPKDIPKLEPRLRSRFEGGLIADIQPPTFETRLAILGRRADELKLKLSPEIADLLALAFPENVRRLDGALTKLHAYSSFTGKNLTIQLVEQVMQISSQNLKQDLEQDSKQIPNRESTKIEPVNKTNTILNRNSAIQERKNIDQESEQIISTTITLVASKLNISTKQILSRDNSAEVKNARQVCITIVRSLGITLGEISKTFERGNSAILNSCRRIKQEMETNERLKSIISEVEEEVRKLISPQNLSKSHLSSLSVSLNPACDSE